MAQDKLAKRSNDKTAISQISKQQSVSWLAQKLAEAMTYWKTEMTTAEQTLYLREWGILAAEVGRRSFEAGLANCFQKVDFIPRAVKIREYIPVVEEQFHGTYLGLTAKERALLDAEQATPEWEAARDAFREELMRAVKRAEMDKPKPNSARRTELKAQAARLEGK